jgi:sugar phosphate isomerase/epimerase
MYANLAFGAVRIRGLDLRQQIDVAKESGFEGIDLPVDLVPQRTPARDARGMKRDAGQTGGGFILPVQFRQDEATYKSELAALPVVAAAAREAGCDLCYTYIQSGHDELEYAANFRLHVARLKPIARILADHGVRFAPEFVGTRTKRESFKHPFIYRIDQILELIAALEMPAGSTGLLLDSFHWYTSGATVDDVTTRLAGGKVFFVHVNDAAWGRTADEQIDNERTLPCETGIIDLAGFVRGLRGIGYAGPVTAEPMMNELLRYPPIVVARRTRESIRRFLELT